MSADNSADKPQFVKNQMLTHDSLNNLVEFSAGRTQRVMKALGLGGTVSGVSWRFENNQIIIEPGFIVFPDGEVAEILETLTFNEIGTDGFLKNTATPVNTINNISNQLQVSYKWAEHKTSSDCFQAVTGQQRMDLAWQLQTSNTAPNTPTKTTGLFKPISFTLDQLGDTNHQSFFASKLNTQISLYNELSADIASTFGIKDRAEIQSIDSEKIKRQSGQGLGILGDVSFEIAFFARRLSLASKSLREVNSHGQKIWNAITLNRGDNRGRQRNPATIDSLLFEISLCNKVASGSIAKNISVINERNTFPDSKPQGVCAQRGNIFISGVFLSDTAAILKSSCECEETTEDFEFSYHTPREWISGIPFNLYDRVYKESTQWKISKGRMVDSISSSRAITDQLLTISSFQHKSDGALLLIPDNKDQRLGFLKPYREW